MVVDHVLDHGQTALVARLNEALVGLGAAILLLHRVPEDAVVSPVVGAVERVHRKHFDGVDAEFDQVVEAGDGRVEGALRRELADVEFVDQGAGQVASLPRPIRPGVGSWVELPAQFMHALGLAQRTGVREGALAVDDEAVVDGVVGQTR